MSSPARQRHCAAFTLLELLIAVSIFMLIAYLPWSKLGHLVYRTTALIYARYIGRLPIGEKLIEDDKIFVI